MDGLTVDDRGGRFLMYRVELKGDQPDSYPIGGYFQFLMYRVELKERICPFCAICFRL